MLFGLGLFVLSTLACGIAWREDLLIIARAACGVSAGAFLPTCYAFVGDAVPYDRQARVMGRVMFGWSLSLVVGVPLGGLVGQMLGWRMTFVVVATAGAIAFGMLSGFATRYKPRKHVETASIVVQWRLPSSVLYVFGAIRIHLGAPKRRDDQRVRSLLPESIRPQPRCGSPCGAARNRYAVTPFGNAPVSSRSRD